MALRKCPVIMCHADVNSAYANLAIAEFPYLKGKCVAVGGDQKSRHGVLLASNQQAKQYGIKTGSALWEAKALCPSLEIVPIHDLGRKTIRRMSDTLVDMCYSLTPNLALEGDDGVYMDWTGCARDFEEAEFMAHKLRLQFMHSTGLTISVGVSFNRNFAKIGSDYLKPFGTTVIHHENWQSLVWPLPVSDLYWVGPATTRKFTAMGIRTIGELAAYDLDYIFDRFGVVGRMLWHFANGRDTTPIAFKDDHPDMVTVGNSTTALEDMRSLDDILGYASKLCNLVSESLRSAGVMCNRIQVGLRSAENLGWIERQKKLPFPSRTNRLLFDQSNMLIQRHWDGKPLRGIGIRACDLIDDDYLQLTLLPEMLRDQTSERIDRAVQDIHRRMGPKMVVSGRVFLNRALMGLDLSSGESAQKNAFRRF